MGQYDSDYWKARSGAVDVPRTPGEFAGHHDRLSQMERDAAHLQASIWQSAAPVHREASAAEQSAREPSTIGSTAQSFAVLAGLLTLGWGALVAGWGLPTLVVNAAIAGMAGALAGAVLHVALVVLGWALRVAVVGLSIWFVLQLLGGLAGA